MHSKGRQQTTSSLRLFTPSLSFEREKNSERSERKGGTRGVGEGVQGEWRAKRVTEQFSRGSFRLVYDGRKIQENRGL